MRQSLLSVAAVAGLLIASAGREAAAAPVTTASRVTAPAASGFVTKVYYYHGRYYPYYYRGGYYPYRYGSRYYHHRYYRYGRWHYY